MEGNEGGEGKKETVQGGGEEGE